MREREKIIGERKHASEKGLMWLILEVLLDIRDLIDEKKPLNTMEEKLK